jgi:NAD(P)-dependent dehydrogenase (short-subunit alcohol dehydrogenase family)
MRGKVVAITGTTTGTGYVAAREIAKKGGEVLLLNRKSPRVQKALSSLQSEVPEGKFVDVECDLQSQASVDQAIAYIKQNYQALDVLCNNAAVMALGDYATADGYDVQMQTNALSHFQLVKGLLPLLKASKAARVVNHSSQARLGGPLEAKYFGKNSGSLGGDGTEADSASFSGPRWERYHQTKLANFVFTYALKDKLAQAGITNIACFAAHPGLSATNLQVTTAADGGMEANSPLMENAQSAEDGATGIIRACMDPAAEDGDFFGPQGWTGFPEKLTPEADLLTESNKEIFWAGCEAAVGKVDLTL